MEKELKATQPNQRIDACLARMYPDYSRNYFKSLIQRGLVLINGAKTEPDYLLKESDSINVDFPENTKTDYSNCPLEIIHEDDSILVINKPFGISAHPALRHVKKEELTISDIVASRRPTGKIDRSGLVHRLDKDTSGVMIIAKTPSAQYNIMKQFMHRVVEKVYLALVSGRFTETKGKIDAPMERDRQNRRKFKIGAGRNAITDFKVKETYKDNSLLEIHPTTGRTHQIRVHMNSIGHSILGDKIYATDDSTKESERLGVSRQMLHAWKLKIIHPVTKKETQFTAKLPEDFMKTMKLLRKGAAIAAVTGLCLCVSLIVPGGAQTIKKPTAAKKTMAAPAPASAAKDIKNIEAEVKQLSDDLADFQKAYDEESKVLSENQQKLYDDQADVKNRTKETNMAVTELNRKLTELQSQLDQFKTETKMQKVTDQDKKSSAQ
ncbi:MAG: hypothetical protein A2297_02015, partial [Elusimicrobia bacterium RIFOXYB2_FULL_48_7]